MGLVEKALKYQDEELLDYAADLIDVAEYDNKADLRTYIFGTKDRLSKNDCAYRHGRYCCYSDESVRGAKRQLEQAAYGDFNEAMQVLERDLFNDSYGDAIESDIYRPNLFSEKDKKLWECLRQPLKVSVVDSDGEKRGIAIMKAYNALRADRQKVCGPLIPVMYAFYIKRANGESVGVTVRLIWDDGCVRVDTCADVPFYKELDAFFIETNPIKSLDDFNEDHLPRQIGEYLLDGVDAYSMFCYEL